MVAIDLQFIVNKEMTERKRACLANRLFTKNVLAVSCKRLERADEFSVNRSSSNERCSIWRQTGAEREREAMSPKDK